MSDENTTQAPGSQAASVPSAAIDGQVAGTQQVDKARLDNAMLKIQELTLANRQLATENESLKANAGALQSQMTSSAAEYAAKTGDLSKQLTDFTTRELGHVAAAKAHEDLQRKLKAIKAVNAPQLLTILDVLPSAETDEAQIEAIRSIAQFASAQVTARETELTAGTTKTTVVPSAKRTEAPTTDEGWAKLIESAPLGSEERGKVMDDWYATFMK